MKSTITNAAEISVLEPIDNNYKTGGGDISVGGCLVIASKGKPFTPVEIYGGTSDIEDVFGTPLPKKATGMEGLRHLHDACEGCSYVNAARVVNRLRYRYPSQTFLVFNDTGENWQASHAYAAGDVITHQGVRYICVNSHTSNTSITPASPTQTDWTVFTGPAVPGAHRYNEDIIAGDGAMFVIYPVDGDTSVNRTIRITDVDTDAERFTITFYDKDILGEEYKLESYTVGVDPDDKDDMGLSAYIETVLEKSTRFRADFAESLTWNDVVASLQAIESTTAVTQDFAFTGGTAGGEPEMDDWKTGINIFRNERIACNLFFAAGVYDPDLIVAMASVADERHIAFFFDVPPGCKADEAIDWITDLGLKSRHSRAFYSPYTANDQWRGGKCVWGVSGAMAAAKARCNKIVTVGVTPGVHYAPAGEKRAYLTRTGLAQLFPEDRMNRDTFYDYRINPIIPRATGGCAGDDDMVQWHQTNYLRFGWINDVLDYIDHRFVEAATQAKFEPDGLTREILTDLTTRIMEDLVTSGALVTPREPERDGTKPYIITVKQEEIDLWKVTWEVCITGAARRIAGQPKLIR